MQANYLLELASGSACSLRLAARFENHCGEIAVQWPEQTWRPQTRLPGPPDGQIAVKGLAK